jgi:hypothetical protein
MEGGNKIFSAKYYDILEKTAFESYMFSKAVNFLELLLQKIRKVLFCQTLYNVILSHNMVIPRFVFA